MKNTKECPAVPMMFAAIIKRPSSYSRKIKNELKKALPIMIFDEYFK